MSDSSSQQPGQQPWKSPAAQKYEPSNPARELDTGAGGPAPRSDPNPQQAGQQPASGADAAFKKYGYHGPTRPSDPGHADKQ